MIRPRCPDPELIARLLERRLARPLRRRLLNHAAVCIPCRRQLAVGSLRPIGPLRASLCQALASEWIAAAAALILLPAVLWMLTRESESEPAPRTGVERRTARTALPRTGGPLHSSVAPEVSEEGDPATLSAAAERTDVGHAPHVPEAPAAPFSAPPPARKPEEFKTAPPSRETAVAAPVPAPAEAPKPPLEPESPARLAVLDPFGSLALEGVGGRVAIQTTSIVPVDGRLTAVGRPAGFRLADGTRMQLAAGSTVSLFHNAGLRCPGLVLYQGMMIVDSARAQSLYLRRNKAAGVLEGYSGLVHLSAGTRPDALSVIALGSGGVWRRNGHAAVEIGSGDLLSVESDGQDLARRAGRAKASMSKFASWPEQSTTLFHASFEEDVQGGERPVVVDGTTKEGYVSAVLNPQRRKGIELALPSTLPSGTDLVVRLKFRTTGARLQCGWGSRDSRDSRGVVQAVAPRNRSESAWTTLTFTLQAQDADGHGRSRRNGRCSLTFTVEPPARVAAEDLLFDIDEIEILRP